MKNSTRVRPLAISNIPDAWEIYRAKNIFIPIDIRSQAGNEELLSVSHITGVTPRSEKNVTMFQAESYEGHKLCYPGDLVVNSLWAWMRALGFSEHHGIISTAYSVYRLRDPRAHNYRYYDYLLRSDLYAGEYLVRSKGIWTSRLQLTDDAFFTIPIITPPRAEQDAIVAFLDEKLADIDRYIDAKRKLIDRLNELKAAIINQAVTKGLDANAPMKDSGIEWLGKVPEGWAKKSLKHVARVQTGVTLGKSYTNNQELRSYPYLRVANVQDGYLDLTDVAQISVKESEANRSRLQVGDVLMTEGGDIDKLGRGYIWHGEVENCLHQNHIFAVRPNKRELHPEYLAMLMTSEHGRNYFYTTAKQTTNLASTNSSTLRAFPLYLPIVGEQQAILRFITERTRDIDTAISKTIEEISHVQSYRISLIAEVVTGKIDIL